MKLDRGATVGSDAGLPVTETFAGGETAQLGTAALCDTSGRVSDGSRFILRHAYDFYTLRSSRHDAAPAALFRFRADIDANTGLESAIYDTADQKTELAYDVLGRLTGETPEAKKQASTSITYVNEADARPKVTTVEEFAGTNLVETVVWEDGFGRPLRERRWQPQADGTTLVRTRKELTYDVLGRLTAETSWQTDSAEMPPVPPFDAARATTMSDYDVFGRPGKQTLPDGSTIDFTYVGERLTGQTVDIRTSSTGPPAGRTTEATTTTERDALGRVVRVATPNHTTTTVYDVFGQRRGATRSGGTVAQTRSWGQDARGLLLSEQLPELGSGGNGTRRFQPDALGNVRRAWGSGPDLTFSYDDLGRLTEIRETGIASVPGAVWLENQYAAFNGGTDNKKKGKLVSAKRHNHFTNGGLWTVQEKYEYKAELGLLSERETIVTDVVSGKVDASFRTGFGYDPLGNLNWISYPECFRTGLEFAQCEDSPEDDRAPQAVFAGTFRQGKLTKATYKWTVGETQQEKADAGFSYHPNGQLARIDYSNGTRTVIDQGTRGMTRPGRIQVKQKITAQTSVTHWDSGTFSYDEAGNIWQIGSDSYLYDTNSRLISSQFSAHGGIRSSTYTYDAADNITSFSRDGHPAKKLTVDETSNRTISDDPVTNGFSNFSYDGGGRLTTAGLNAFGGDLFTMRYDPFGMQTEFEVQLDGGVAEKVWISVYGPGNYRVVEAHVDTTKPSQERIYRFRDLEGRLLREYKVTGFGPFVNASKKGAVWKHEQDYYRAGNRVVSTYSTADLDWRFFHQDHLGTTKVITNADGGLRDVNHYYPYGRFVFAGASIPEPTPGFTGHERDGNSSSIYMLGRTYLEPFFRFASPDPARDGWNLYAYVGGNPIKFLDPTGREATFGLALGAAAVGRSEEEQTELISTITQDQARIQGGGIVAVASLAIPGPEDLVLGAAVVTKAVGALGRLGRGIKKFLRQADEVETGPCFVAGTLVATEEGLQPIETISAGDRVWSYDLSEASWMLKSVVAPLSHEYAGKLYRIRIDGSHLQATPNHPFWVVAGRHLAGRPLAHHVPLEEQPLDTGHGRWVSAADLEIGDSVILRDRGTMRIEAIEIRFFRGPVYNLEIVDLNNYSVGEASVLVHNKATRNSNPGRVKGNDSLNARIDRLASITKKQKLGREGKTSGIIVDSTKKSKDRVDIALRNIKGLDDIDEFE